jgi:quercetin dioxygenase-like cupin family protein
VAVDGVESKRVGELLKITPTESIEIVPTDEDAFLVDATYEPGGPPPKHFHPGQDERFDVLRGTVRVVVDGRERDHGPGAEIEIPGGTVHTFWNAGGEPALVRWRTSPAGRTEQWFRAIDRIRGEGRVGRGGMPGPLAFGVLLTEYRDTFRLAGPDLLLRPALAALAEVGRRRGYRP